MSKYEIAVFDVDGTLLDTREGVLSAVKEVIVNHDLPMPTPEVLETFIGPPIQDSLAKTFHLEKAKADELAAEFRTSYKGPNLIKAKPYDGIYELMDELVKRNIKIAVATYKRQDYAEDILKHFGFDIIIAATKSDKLNRSQIPKQLAVIRKTLKLQPQDVLIPFSGEKKTGVEELWTEIEKFLPGGEKAAEFETEAEE